MLLRAVVMLALMATGAGATDPGIMMRYRDGLLTVRIEQVPLDLVVARLEQETGVKFHGELLDWRQVTKSFDSVPLDEALDRILGRQNFVLRYDAAGHPESVELCGLPEPRQTAKTRTATSSTNVLKVLGTAPPVTVNPRLRAALHTNTATLVQLSVATLQQADAGVRAEARRTLLDAVEANRSLRDRLSEADPNSVVPLVRSLPPERADALLLDLDRGARDPVLRRFFARARAQLQQERAVRSGQSRG